MTKPEDTADDMDRVITLTFKKSADEIVQYLRRRTGTPEDAEDLAQETWIRLLRGRGFANAHNKRAYLFGVAAHTLKNCVRRAARRRRIQQGYDASESAVLSARPADPSELAEQSQLRRRVNEALQRLSPLHAAVLLYIKRDGLTYEQTAARSGLSVEDVKQYLHEARGRMQVFLRNYRERDTQ